VIQGGTYQFVGPLLYSLILINKLYLSKFDLMVKYSEGSFETEPNLINENYKK